MPQSSGASPCGRGGWTTDVSIPTYDAQANEQGNGGSHRIGWMFAVKKGLVAEGSSGKTSIFSGGTGADPGTSSVGVNLKRATCLSMTEASVLRWPLEDLTGATAVAANEGVVFARMTAYETFTHGHHVGQKEGRQTDFGVFQFLRPREDRSAQLPIPSPL